MRAGTPAAAILFVTGPFTFSTRHLDPAVAETARAEVESHLEKLNAIAPELIACRVTVESAQRRHARPEDDFHVRIVATIPPNKELVVSEDTPPEIKGDALAGVIRQAFHVLERIVKDERARRRGDVKAHAQP